MLGGVVSMPSNIFATTGTNVSILFIDATNDGDVILIDASNLGEKIKEGKNQKTVLRHDEEKQIIETFNAKKAIEDFSVVVSYDEIEAKNYSFSAGQYFDVKIEHAEISEQDFDARLAGYQTRLKALFAHSRSAEEEITAKLGKLSYEK
jgi:type I restriction enzyme M protein